MKSLILIRHAKASWGHRQLDDFDRPLDARGRRDAEVIGKKLAKNNCAPDYVLSSPAIRAFSTAKIVASEIGFPEDRIATNRRIYEATVSDLVDVVRQIDRGFNYILLFGHNPGMNALSLYLTKYPVGNIPPCGVLGIEYEIHSWREITEGIGRFVFFDYPENPPRASR